jgi:hypothetical protein
MRAIVWLLPALVGCSTASLRAGVVVAGGKPAFVASFEIGASFGTKRLYQMTHEHGIQGDAAGAHYTNGIGADVVTLDEDRAPIARIGPRLRGSTDGNVSIGARGTFYMLGDPKSGVGFDLGGGIPLEGDDLVIEAAIVMTAKWKVL